MPGIPKHDDLDPQEVNKREAERKALALHIHLCRLAEEARASGLEYTAMLIDTAARSCIDSSRQQANAQPRGD
jgi:hypothetical protein